jgi:hypothetical protein
MTSFCSDSIHFVFQTTAVIEDVALPAGDGEAKPELGVAMAFFATAGPELGFDAASLFTNGFLNSG